MAGLIPQSFIDDLLHRTDILEVVDKRVPLKKSGKNYQACCPFHNEKTPSFSVQPERQFYYCFGCGAGGNAIGFVMNFDHLDFPQAVETLARDAGVEVPREESKAETRRQSEHAKLLDVLEQASKFYQFQLRHHAERKRPIEYLKTRGVSGEIARDFAIGYAPPGWDKLIEAIGVDAQQQKNLLKAGMVIERNKPEGEEVRKDNDKRSPYYDRFRDRIMFPIRDSRGRTIAFGGRVLGDDKPKYLNSPETPVFHKGAELYGLYESKKFGDKFSRLLLVEGYMDVIALAQMGIRNAVATLGTATSDRHLTRMFRAVSEVVFCFDGDAAGLNAAWRALETSLPLMEDGRRVRFLFLPEGDDPDTHVRKVGKDKFLEQVEQSVPLEQFFFDKLSEDLDIDSIEGKARLSNLAKPLIRQLPKGVYGQLMLDRLSDTLGVSSESLDQFMATAPDPAQRPPPPEMAPPPEDHGAPPPYGAPQSRPSDRGPGVALTKIRKPASIKAIELLLRNPEIALALEANLESLRYAEDESRKLLCTLIEKVQNEPQIETYTLLGYCYGTHLGGQLTQLLQAEKITPQEGLEEEFKQIIDNILSDIQQKLHLLRLKDELKSRISAANESNAEGPDQL
ncbi:MAG TPA: DNA primase [Gammaproteobacteria bacterium]|nr:DNA primase [Gammaproteobacteria bacterium]HAR91293.1 DNA primase [Gammaproteobacteria bacterium]HCI87386.1 DNA primase [Gammaproteobacteria bacterium]|tara:strand:+ start:17112 stop:18980 length:1869 start_codon:yes stop_codon:yes gene_type:complete